MPEIPSASYGTRDDDHSLQVFHREPSNTENRSGHSGTVQSEEYTMPGTPRLPRYHHQGSRCKVIYRNDHVTTVSTITENDDRTNSPPATQPHGPQRTYKNYDENDDERQSPTSIRTQYGIPESAGTISERGQNAAMEEENSDEELYQHSTEVVSVLNFSSDEENNVEISNQSLEWQAVNELYDSENNNDNLLPPNAGFDVVEVRDINQDCEDGESDHNDVSNDADTDGDDDQTMQKMKKGQNRQKKCNKGKEIKKDSLETTNVEILVIADLVLKEMRNHPTVEKKCYVHVQNDLDFNNASSVGSSLPRFPKLKSVFLHCGFRHAKKDVDKFLKQKIKETINSLDDQFPEANVVLSAVLPFRGNKNRAKIDQLNMTIEEICDETSAEFEDFTIALMNENTAEIKKDVFSDTVSLNKEGIERIAKSFAHKAEGHASHGDNQGKVHTSRVILNGENTSTNPEIPVYV